MTSKVKNEIETHGLKCKHCASNYLGNRAELSMGISFRCLSCRQRSTWAKSELEKILKARNADALHNKAKASVGSTLFDIINKAKIRLPDAQDQYADIETLEKEDLYSFQEQDVDFFMDLFNSKDDRGNDIQTVLNFNDMGLGKSPEAITCANLLESKRVLIICTKNSMLNWKKLIYMWSQEDSALTLNSTLDKFEDWKAKMLGRWFITNVETLRKPEWSQFVLSYAFDFVVYDESHSMRNVSTAVKARQAKLFLDAYLNKTKNDNPSGKLMLMTGSPIVNSAGDIQPHLALAYPDESTFQARAEFLNRYCRMGWKAPKAKEAKILGFINPKFINEKIEARGVQHIKADVLKDLPEKSYNIIPLEMGPEQRDLYEDIKFGLSVMLDDGKELHAPEVLEQLIRMRQICVDPALIGKQTVPSVKLDYIANTFLDEIGSKPFVMFSTFETILANKIKEMMERRNKRIGLITGKINQDDRFENVEKFQNGELDVIFATIQAGSESITLTRASHVVMIDRWWTPGSNEQAVDRLHRISQENAVTVHWLQIQDAFDIYLDKVLQDKRRVAESARTGIDFAAADVSSIQREVTERMFR